MCFVLINKLITYFSLLVDEINSYDEKTKEQEANLEEKNLEDGVVSIKRIKDFKKTSLLKPISVFEQFLRTLEKSLKGKLLEASGRYNYFKTSVRYSSIASLFR